MLQKVFEILRKYSEEFSTFPNQFTSPKNCYLESQKY